MLSEESLLKNTSYKELDRIQSPAEFKLSTRKESNLSSIKNISRNELTESIRKNFRKKSSMLFKSFRERPILEEIISTNRDTVDKSGSNKQVSFKELSLKEKIDANTSIDNNLERIMDPSLYIENNGAPLHEESPYKNYEYYNTIENGLNTPRKKISSQAALRSMTKPKIILNNTGISESNNVENSNLESLRDNSMFDVRRFGSNVNKILTKDEELNKFSKYYYEQKKKRAESQLLKPVFKEKVSYDKYYEDLRNDYLKHENKNCRSIIKDLKVHVNVDLNMMLHEYKIAKELRTEAWKNKIAQSSRANSQRSFNQHKTYSNENSNYLIHSERKFSDVAGKYITEAETSRIINNHCIDPLLLLNTNYEQKLQEFVEMNNDRINDTDLSTTQSKVTNFKMNCFNTRQNISNERV